MQLFVLKGNLACQSTYYYRASHHVAHLKSPAGISGRACSWVRRGALLLLWLLLLLLLVSALTLWRCTVQMLLAMSRICTHALRVDAIT